MYLLQCIITITSYKLDMIKMSSRLIRKKIPEQIKSNLFRKQDGRCAVCTEILCYEEGDIQLFDVDHIIQHSLTQDDNESNLQLLCLPCHRIKTIQELKEKYRKMRKEKLLKLNGPDNIFNRFRYTPSE